MVLAASMNDREEPLLSGHDRALRILLLFALVLQLASWLMQRGYPIADAVEFMERAKAWVYGEPLGDGNTVRSFAFSSLFVPPFAIARALGVEDLRPIVTIARLMQVALALGLVAACARLGQRVAGRSAGLAVGYIVAINPLVLQFGVFPVSGIAATLCLALGLARVIRRGSRRDSLIGGLWLGLGFLMAYQSLLVTLAVLLLLLVRDRWAARRTWMLAGSGLLGCCALQLCLDRGVYGRWDGSLWRYLLDNAGFTIARVVFDLGFRNAAGTLYEQLTVMRGFDTIQTDVATDAMMRYGFSWYAFNAPSFFVWPLLVLLFVGVAHALLKPRWTSTLVVLTLAIALFVMGKKGAKSLRLCLPLIPLFVPLLALAWAWLAQRNALRLLAQLALLAALPLSLLVLSRTSLREYSAYWDGADYVSAHSAPALGDARTQVASTFDWAVFLRFPEHVEKIKLPVVIDRWATLKPADLARAEQVIEQLDWLILHEALFKSQPNLTAFLAPRFCVAAAFYDKDMGTELGPVIVLRRADNGGARLAHYQSTPPDPMQRQRLEFRSVNGTLQLALLGFDLQQLPGSGWWWISYHWELQPGCTELEVRDRITGPDGSYSWQNNHPLARGLSLPSEGAQYLSEGYLLVPIGRKQLGSLDYRPLGGRWLRGDLIPARLWVAVRDRTDQQMIAPFRSGSSIPMQREFQSPKWAWSAAGNRLSPDGFAQAGGFFLPVHASAHLPDDDLSALK
jgi:hypothetical protein